MLSKGLSVFCSCLQSFCLGLFLSGVGSPIFRSSASYIFPQHHCICKLAGGPTYPRDVFPMFMSICNSEESLTLEKWEGKSVTENLTWNQPIIKTKINYSRSKHLRKRHYWAIYFYTWFFKTEEPFHSINWSLWISESAPPHTHIHTRVTWRKPIPILSLTSDPVPSFE